MKEPDMKKPSETNWERLDAMTNDIIDTSDIPPLTDEWFKNAKRRMPKKPVAVTVQVETDVLAWYKAQGDDYTRRMSAALRIYAEAHQEGFDCEGVSAQGVAAEMPDRIFRIEDMTSQRVVLDVPEKVHLAETTD